MKTAVEWLVEHLTAIGHLEIPQGSNIVTAIISEAKEMEKEQIGYPKEKVDKLIDALYDNNMCSTIGDELIETFKSK